MSRHSHHCRRQPSLNCDAFIKVIKHAFNNVRDNISSLIRNDVSYFLDTLVTLFGNLLAQLEQVGKTLGSYVVELAKWIKEAEDNIAIPLNMVKEL
ncbi:hypothetical protein, conserved [Babesia ovata]|uniref:Uncharacterized protein n=1 Tax=Babesia ovata TaxID=189622 RepID=A0A2H6K877_9APIC|nr:uncharacterized protein BOVATA_006710 [Babesia ovata]GBE59178.1 hypothetical protein, conserved [Babesia ovata]